MAAASAPTNMRRRAKRWRMLSRDQADVSSLAAELGLSQLAAKLLVQRGLSDPAAASEFLNPTFDRLSDPFLLPDAEAAAERIKQALAAKERIRVHGDYDGDGVSSAALWTRLIEKLGGDVSVHVPHRKHDGYDMRSKFVAQAATDGVKLIITTDCGIQRLDEVEEARAAGIDVIITDHHEPGATLPKAVAVVNPHRADSRYPFPDLAGVGVAFRMGEALVRHLGMGVDGYRRAYCDLAAIGTVTDVMPLLGENRIMVKHGLEALTATRKPGLRALMQKAKLLERPLTSHGIGYGIGPRLNAIGRVDDAKLALDLLLTRDQAEGDELAGKLERANFDRRQEELRIFTEATQLASGLDMEETGCLVLAGTGWHAGVIGIVASRMVERFCRPAVMIALDEETGRGRGSARSIRAFDLYAAVHASGHHLIEFGGHAHAAGFAIAQDQIGAFREAMNTRAMAELTQDDFVPEICIDSEIGFEELTVELVSDLDRLEPWGHSNSEPILVTTGLRVAEIKRIGKEANHLKMRMHTRNAEPVDALMWNSAELADHIQPGALMDVCYKPQINLFNGRTSVQMMIVDMKASEQ